jgi:hypothetical protein
MKMFGQLLKKWCHGLNPSPSNNCLLMLCIILPPKQISINFEDYSYLTQMPDDDRQPPKAFCFYFSCVIGHRQVSSFSNVTGYSEGRVKYSSRLKGNKCKIKGKYVRAGLLIFGTVFY